MLSMLTSHLYISGGKVSKLAKSQHPGKIHLLLEEISHLHMGMEDSGRRRHGGSYSNPTLV